MEPYRNPRFCNRKYTDFINANHENELCGLSPAKRAARRFSLMLRDIPIHFEKEDRFCGHFGFAVPIDAKPVPPYLPAPFTVPDEIIRDMERMKAEYNSKAAFDRGHVTVDYETVITRGLRYYAALADEAALAHPESEMPAAMKETLLAVKTFGERIAAEAEMLAAHREGEEKARLLAIAQMTRRVPYEPARTFTEALQAIWIIHFTVPMATGAWFSISLGRFDRYMRPFYLKALADGVTEEELTAEMYEFYCLLNSYADGACALNVGPDYTEFSDFVIACQKKFSFPGPILAARVGAETTEKALLSLIDDTLFSRGQPSFYFEENCRDALLEKGLPKELAERFAVESCMGFGIPGDELNSMWGCVLESNLILNRAVREAVEGKNAPITDRAALVDRFVAKAEEVFRTLADIYEVWAKERELCHPDVYGSALTERAVRAGVDRVSGVGYHNVTVECIGLANVADGIGAICRLVFDEKKYTLAEFSEAVASNYENTALWADVLACPKYGAGDPAADALMAELMERMQRVIRARDHGNFYYLPSLHTLDTNVSHGLACGAGFDGRREGESVAKNAGPSNRVRRKDPAAVVLSAARLPQRLFYGGQPIDLHFTSADVREHPEAIAAVLLSYRKLGGFQIQVNSLSSKLLKKAVADPQNYTDLVVRIGGYSCYFNSLSAKNKEEFITRFEKEEA